jgi:hypothetical protein
MKQNFDMKYKCPELSLMVKTLASLIEEESPGLLVGYSQVF